MSAPASRPLPMSQSDRNALASLARFREEHGHSDVRFTYADPNGLRLGIKVSEWRKKHRHNKLSPELRAALTDLGFVWVVDRQAPTRVKPKAPPKRRSLTPKERAQLRALGLPQPGRATPEAADLFLALWEDGVTQGEIGDAANLAEQTVRIRCREAKRRRREAEVTSRPED